MNSMRDREMVRNVVFRADQIQVGDVIQNAGSGKWYEVTGTRAVRTEGLPDRVALQLVGEHGPVSNPWLVPAFRPITTQVLV